MAKYKVLQTTKVYEVIASSAGFSPDKYITVNKGEIIEGTINTVSTGYAPVTALFFNKNKKPYSIKPSLISEVSNNIGTSNIKSTEAKDLFTPKNIIIGLVVIGLVVSGLKLAKVF